MPSPELLDLVANLPADSIPEDLFPREEMPALRKGQEEMMSNFYPLPEGIETEDIEASGVAATWFSHGDSNAERVILYVHGGGFMWGSPRTHGELISRVCLEAGVRCLAVDYRETPEHVFPAALDDCAALYQWLLDQGVRAQHIALVGDSAGGGLVLSTLVRLQAQGLPYPAAAVATSAFTDLTLSGDSMKTVKDPLCTEKGLKLLADTYAGGHDLTDPELSPLFADKTGFPPLLLQVAENELLRDDTVRFARSATDSGVDNSLEIYPGACHLWHWFGPQVPESVAALESIAKFLKQHLWR